MSTDAAPVEGQIIEAVLVSGGSRHHRMLSARSRGNRGNGGAACALAFACLAQPAQPVHEHRIVGRRIRLVDDPAEELVVARRREPELRADRLLLGRIVTAPARLEVKEQAVTVGEGHTSR